jgi:hypothetical protein
VGCKSMLARCWQVETTWDLRTHNRLKNKLGVRALRSAAREEAAEFGVGAQALLVGPMDVCCGHEVSSALSQRVPAA